VIDKGPLNGLLSLVLCGTGRDVHGSKNAGPAGNQPQPRPARFRYGMTLVCST